MNKINVKPSPNICWLVLKRGITLVSPETGPLASIPYPYAGLWALIAEGNVSQERARDLMAVLMSIDEQEAQGQVINTLTAWQKAGFVVGK